VVKCNKSHYGDILDIIDEDSLEFKQNLMAWLSSPICHIFLDDDKNICMLFIPITLTKFDCHLHRKSRVKSKVMLEFMGSCVDWMFDNTDAIVLMNFVPIENRPLRLFMGHVGSVCMGTMKNTGRYGKDEVLYCYYKDMNINRDKYRGEV
jgi:hypothetical protein